MSVGSIVTAATITIAIIYLFSNPAVSDPGSIGEEEGLDPDFRGKHHMYSSVRADLEQSVAALRPLSVQEVMQSLSLTGPIRGGGEEGQGEMSGSDGEFATP